MERQVQQLVEMVTHTYRIPRVPHVNVIQGATVAQARAALKEHRDVMEAAERIFDGSFDHIVDEDGDVPMSSSATIQQKPRMMVRCVRRIDALRCPTSEL